jgi:hypothetical protein
MASPGFRGAATEAAHARILAALASWMDAERFAALQGRLAAPGVANAKYLDETVPVHTEILAVLAEALAAGGAPATTKAKQGGSRE